MSGRLVAPWSQSKYLTGTSLLFLGPSLYAYRLEQPLISLLLTITSLVSANFWRKANYTIRRHCDLVMAKVTMAILCYNAAKHITYVRAGLMCYPALMMLTYTYYKSHELFNQGNDKWLIYHMTTHAAMTYEQYAIVYIIDVSPIHGTNTQRDTILIMCLMIIYFRGLHEIKGRIR